LGCFGNNVDSVCGSLVINHAKRTPFHIHAQQVLEKSDRAKITELAQTIIDSQQQIDQIQQRQKDWYGQ
jgi:uncharacterized protein (DUF305 family)